MRVTPAPVWNYLFPDSPLFFGENTRSCFLLLQTPKYCANIRLAYKILWRCNMTEKEWLGEENQLGMDIWTRKYQNESYRGK